MGCIALITHHILHKVVLLRYCFYNFRKFKMWSGFTTAGPASLSVTGSGATTPAHTHQGEQVKKQWFSKAHRPNGGFFVFTPIYSTKKASGLGYN